MTELIRDWVLGIVAVSLLSSFALSLAGETPSRRIIKLISALAFILVIVLPLKKNGGEIISLSLEEYQLSYQRESGYTAASSEELILDLTKASLEEYITGLTKNDGVSGLDIKMEMKDGYALPVSCRLKLEDGADADALYSKVAAELGIDQSQITRW